jgi:PAS domain S-box-containing protein
MTAWLRRLMIPPALPPEEQLRMTAVLKVILWAALATLLIYVAIALLLSPDVAVLLPSGVFALIVLVPLWLLRRGTVHLASLVFCLGAFGGLVLAAYAFGGVRGSSYSALVLVIIIAGVLLGGRAALVMALLSVSAGGVLVYLESTGQFTLNLVHPTPVDTWLGASLTFALAAILLAITSRGMRSAFAMTRDSQYALEARTRELERERSALRASEERYRNFVEQSMEGIWLLEFDQPIPVDLPPHEQVHLIHQTGYVAECNEALARMYGYTARTELLGRRLLELYGGKVPDENVQATLQLVTSDYRSGNRETQEMNQDDEPVYFLNNAVGVIRDRQLIGVWGSQRDITERKRVDRLLDRRARQLQTAAEVSRAVASILDLQELLPRVVELLLNGFELYYAGLFLKDETGQWAVLRAATGEAGRQMLKTQHRLSIDDRSMIGWCIAHGQARIAVDIGDDPVRFENPLLPATRSEMALPLVSRGRVSGAITIQSDRPAAFETDDIAALQTMVDQVAIAIDNAHLFEAEKQHGELLDALREIGLVLNSELDLPTLLQTIVQRAAFLLDAPMGELLLLQPDGTALVDAARYHAPLNREPIPLGEGVSGRVAASGQTLIVDDYWHWPGRFQPLGEVSYRSVLGVPIQRQSRVIGVLNLLDDRPAQFDQADAEVLQLFAVQAAVALENARLFDTLRQRLDDLSVLHAVAVIATEAADVASLIEQTMEVVGQVLFPDYSGVMLKDEDLNALRVQMYRGGVLAPLPQGLVPLGQGITGTTAVTGRAWRVPDVRREPAYLPYTADTLSELSVPLKVGERVIGVINVESRRLQAFSEADEQLLSTIAGQLATAIERLRTAQEREALITELENKNAELERFTYTVSHDLKSPLITIRGFLGFLEKDATNGNFERLHADIARITNATDKMQRLLHELLELSRVGRLVNAPQAAPFGDIVHDARLLVEGRLAERGVQVVVAPDLPVVLVDRARLIEVVQNLLENAVKFMGDQPEPRIEIGWRAEAHSPVFLVRDNGVGIDPKFHAKVFGLFDKLDPRSEGTGIGLALVKRIIEVHGGRIWVESEGAGCGTTFCFTLPAARA